MKYLAPARRIACALILILSMFNAQRIPARETRADGIAADSIAIPTYQDFGYAIELFGITSSDLSAPRLNTGTSPAFAATAKASLEIALSTGRAQSALPADRPIVVALAEPSKSATAPKQALISTSQASSQLPPPARFFTINQVLAKQKQPASKPSAIQLAAIDPKIMSDGSTAPNPHTRSDEPFGFFTFRAPGGPLWAKWRGVETAIQAEAPALARCRSAANECTPSAARFVGLIKQAESVHGRAKLELVNTRVNAAIQYISDIAQWGVADLWSAPIDTDGKGSFDTGFGDCEDYAIAKYVALREAGVPTEALRILLVRDNSVRLDHAVLAVREDGHWLILDNRWSRLTEDAELRQFVPLFALNDAGVKLFAAPYAALRRDRIPTSNFDSDFSAGGTAIIGNAH